MVTAVEEAVAAEVAEDVEAAVAEGAVVEGDVAGASKPEDGSEDKETQGHEYIVKKIAARSESAHAGFGTTREWANGSRETPKLMRDKEDFWIGDNCTHGTACAALDGSRLVQELHLERRMIPL